jgi:MFS transporter, PPP family, 3-phenylpropionic acid transporter
VAETRRDHVALRLIGFYCASFAVLGMYMQYFPVWLHGRGCSGRDVTIVLSGQIVARTLAGPLWAQRADRGGRPAAVMRILVLLSCGSFAAFWLLHSRVALFCGAVAFGCAWPPIHSLLDSLALGASLQRGFRYTRVRVWGSIAFLGAVAGGGGILQWLGTSAAVYWLVLAGIVLAVVASRWLPDGPPAQHREGPGPLRALLRNGRFLLFLGSVGLVQGSHAAYYGLSTLHWTEHGISAGTAGLLWAEAVLAETILFSCLRGAFERLRPTTWILLGAAGGVVRWLVLGATVSVPALFLVNWLHAASFGCTYLGSMRFIALRVPGEQQATAQGLLGAASSGVFLALATLLAGQAYAAGGGASFTWMAALATAGGVSALWLRRRRRQ